MKKHPIGYFFLTCFVFLACIACTSPSPMPDIALPTATPTPTPTSTTMPHSGDLTLPNPENILLWLDATVGIVVDNENNVVGWTDRLHQTQYTLTAQQVDDALAGLPVIRLSGKQSIVFETDLERGPSTVFVVLKRDVAQTVGPDGQRVLSVWDGHSSRDTQLPNYATVINDGDAVIAPIIYQNSAQDGSRKRFAIGANAIVPQQQRFYGDVAEIIIYQQTFNTYQPVEQILGYLSEKWGLDARANNGWTRAAPLADQDVVHRNTHNYPLSDQNNIEGWSLYEPWTDEFNDGILNTDKWLPHNHVWYGRAPARFLPGNVSEGDGMVKLALRMDASLPPEKLYSAEPLFENYSSATLSSLTAKRYGYVEIRARAGVGSSAFWLYAETWKHGQHNKLEIDVYELGGREHGYEGKYHMNAWVWVKDGVSMAEQTRGVWNSGLRFADNFHVFGIKWTAEVLEYYVDGILVRRMPNVHWHSPLLLLLDTETMPEWFGIPPADHLPGFHEIDYVRTWINAKTVDTWQGEYALKNDPRTNNPTANHVSQYPEHVDTGTPGPLTDRVWCGALPNVVEGTTRYTLAVDYTTANADQDVVLELWSADALLGQGTTPVSAGAGTAKVTISLDTVPVDGLDYHFRASIRPAGSDAAQNHDFCTALLTVGTRIPVSGITLPLDSVMLQPGQAIVLIPHIEPANATDPSVSWHSSNETVATVDEQGLVTGIAAGTATISTTTTDGSWAASSTISVGDTANFVENPGFEDESLNPWTHYGTVAVDTKNARTGGAGIAVTGVGAVEQVVAVAPNTTYQLRGFGKVASEGQRVYVGVKYFADGNNYVDFQITDTAYTEGSCTFTTGPENTTALVYFYVHNAGYQAFGDDFVLTVALTGH